MRSRRRAGRSGAAGLVVETMSDLAEAKIALAAAKSTGLPVVACMVFDSGKDLDRTLMGDSAQRVAKELTEAGADVIGANCGQGISSYINVCSQLCGYRITAMDQSQRGSPADRGRRSRLSNDG
ncbi:MAG: homocysteine S-methyltransferase family protein [Pirellulaceae bacterium]